LFSTGVKDFIARRSSFGVSVINFKNGRSATFLIVAVLQTHVIVKEWGKMKLIVLCLTYLLSIQANISFSSSIRSSSRIKTLIDFFLSTSALISVCNDFPILSLDSNCAMSLLHLTHLCGFYPIACIF